MGRQIQIQVIITKHYLWQGLWKHSGGSGRLSGGGDILTLVFKDLKESAKWRSGARTPLVEGKAKLREKA